MIILDNGYSIENISLVAINGKPLLQFHPLPHKTSCLKRCEHNIQKLSNLLDIVHMETGDLIASQAVIGCS